MSDPKGAADRLIAAYNAKDFDALERLIAPDLDFAHFNRDFAFRERSALIGVLRRFASELMPDRQFLEPERISVFGDIVVREAWYVGTPTVDLPGFAPAGGAVRLKFCSVLRFDEQDRLVEWKDYG